jgi:hypothetical protein
MPPPVPYRGSSNLPAPFVPGPGGGRRRAPKPPLAVRKPNLLQGAAVVGSKLPKLFAGTVYAGLAVTAFVYRAAMPAQIWRFPLYVWVVGVMVAFTAWELVPFLFAIIAFRMRAVAEGWERQQIHEAQTYGDARQGNWMEVHDALRGRAAPSPAQSQEFDE